MVKPINDKFILQLAVLAKKSASDPQEPQSDDWLHNDDDELVVDLDVLDDTQAANASSEETIRQHRVSTLKIIHHPAGFALVGDGDESIVLQDGDQILVGDDSFGVSLTGQVPAPAAEAPEAKPVMTVADEQFDDIWNPQPNNQLAQSHVADPFAQSLNPSLTSSAITSAPAPEPLYHSANALPGLASSHNDNGIIPTAESFTQPNTELLQSQIDSHFSLSPLANEQTSELYIDSRQDYLPAATDHLSATNPLPTAAEANAGQQGNILRDLGISEQASMLANLDAVGEPAQQGNFMQQSPLDLLDDWDNDPMVDTMPAASMVAAQPVLRQAGPMAAPAKPTLNWRERLTMIKQKLIG